MPDAATGCMPVAFISFCNGFDHLEGELATDAAKRWMSDAPTIASGSLRQDDTTAECMLHQ